MTSSDLRIAAPADTIRRAASKVPEITVYFWIIKILTTGMGEAAADYLQWKLTRPGAAAITGAVLVATLVVQLRMNRYVAWAYWSAVVMVSVFGTIAADGLRHGLELSNTQNTVVFSVAVAAIFVAWYLVERTLSIHSIHTVRRESFYWATVIATFALGTAVGDWTAGTWGIGYLASGVMFAVAFAAPGGAYRWARLGAVPAFWASYVMTRPLGASFADWMVAPGKDGLGWGTQLTTAVWTAFIIAFVAYLAIARPDVEKD